MKAYWSRCGHGHGNFGDNLTPLLLRHCGISCEWAPIEHAEIVGIGSVLEKVPENFRGIIWSTGFMHEASRRTFHHSKVLAVRGGLTRDRIDGVTAEVALGDAGLLCDALSASQRKRYKLGLIPHFADAEDPLAKELAALGSDVTVIDVCAETLDVIRQISACENVLSSSLHGLIAADSLAIPSRWVQFDRGARVAGAGFKFRDYYSIFGIEAQPVELKAGTSLDTLLPVIPPFSRPGIDAIKERLRKTLAAVRQQYDSLPPDEVAAKERARAEWHRRLAQLQSEIAREIPAGSQVLMADDDQLRFEISSVQTIPFTERDGAYWGSPGTDGDAVLELRRVRARGVEWFVIAWPMFWLLDHFQQFAGHVAIHWKTIARTEAGIILRARASRYSCNEACE